MVAFSFYVDFLRYDVICVCIGTGSGVPRFLSVSDASFLGYLPRDRGEDKVPFRMALFEAIAILCACI